MKEISLVIPVLNEENNIKPLVERLHAAFMQVGYDYELIFIDDHSEDKTAQQINVLAKQYPIIYSRKKGKRGKAYSLLEGFALTNYSLIGLIDADLQYPPESIAKMLKEVEKGADVVVANRVYAHDNFIRKLVGKTFRLIFAEWMHGFKVDVQSGLKIFKKRIIERVILQPSPWTFDLEFLVQARAAGYKISSVPIEFGKRENGISKINVLEASLQIGKEAIKLKNRPAHVIPLHPEDIKKRGEGFHFNGVEFVHHSKLPISESAIHTLHTHQRVIFKLLLLWFLTGLILDWKLTLTALIAVLTVLYFIDLLFNLSLILRSLAHSPELVITPEQIKEIPDKQWPTYTIFCPLYREWQVVPQFVEAIQKLDYPKNKLQVQLLLEEDDVETVKHVKDYNLPSYFEVIVVPHSLPKTKPKACNYGLKFATGEYSVIYDAEDVPDPLQLKKAVLAFKQLSENTICIQAKLNYYNPHQNLLTRLFTAEYSLWFDLILTGLQSINAPIPLGGTSNHFKTNILKSLHGWDSFNVTEDCDLGMRLVKHGYRTAMIDSTTMEEANSDWKNWINQRSRWIKGYMQSYLVHMRKPSQLWKGIHEPHLLTFQLIVGGKVLSLFINPFMWLTTFLYFALRPLVGTTIEEFFPGPILYMGVFCLIFGNFLYFYYYMIGCAKKKQFGLIKFAFLTPLYWLVMSYASWLALIQLFRKPHFWPKTIHGLHLKKVQSPAAAKVAPKLSPISPIFYKSFLGVYKLIALVGAIVSNIFFSIRLNFIDFISLFAHQKDLSKSPKRKILILNWRDTKHKFAGGAEVYVHELAKRWVKKGYGVTLFCGNDGHDPRYEVMDGIQIIRRGGFFFVYFWAFVYYIFKFRGKYNVILDCENGIPFFTPLFAKEKIYLVIHHVHQEVFRKSLSSPVASFATFLEMKLMPIVYKNVQIITVSKSSKEEIMKLKITKKEPIVVHNGVDINFYVPGKKQKNPMILYLGRLQYYKSLHIFIKSAKKVLEVIPNAEFVIAGFGVEQAGLEKLAVRLGIEKNITFTGRVSEEQKKDLYQRAWVFVNPSFMEGWGITTIEANASGTPVIAANVPGLRDSVRNPHSGFLVPYGNIEEFTARILLLLKDSKIRKNMSENAVEWANKFDWDKSADQALELITK